MFNLVILGNNLKTIKKVINQILIKSNKIKCISIATSITEFLNLITTYKPELLFILDYNSPKIYNLNIANYNPILILFNNSKIYCINMNNKKNIYYPISKENLINYIHKFINNEEKLFIRKKIVSILSKFNFDFKLLGTNYLIDAILYSYMNKNSYISENLEKKVYPHISLKYNTNSKNVKWAIVRSINNMHYNSNKEILKDLEDYFCLDIYQKPTAKIIISTIINKL